MKSNTKTLRTAPAPKVNKPKFRTLKAAGIQEYVGNFASPSTWFREGDSPASALEDGEVSNPFVIVGAEQGEFKGETVIILALMDTIRNPEDDTVYHASLRFSESRAQYLAAFAEDDTPIAARFRTKYTGQPLPFMEIVELDTEAEDDEDGEEVPF